MSGDFNGDGKLDLAVVDYRRLDGGSSRATCCSDGQWRRHIPAGGELPGGHDPTSLVAGDFTDDGDLDLAFADKGAVVDGDDVNGGVGVLLGNGRGTFHAATEFMESGNAPQALVAGDFNGDGRPELAVANSASDDVSILRVRSDGTLQEEGLPLPVGRSPSSLVVGDFTGDGRLDLAVANYASSNVSVLLGDGEGMFQAATNYPVGGGPQSLITGDFTGDGNLDLALANTTSDAISLLLGYGDGMFQQAKQTLLGFTPSAIVDGFFSEDGRLDLAIASSGISSNSGTVSILLGNGDGTFYQPSDGVLPTPVVVGDFNRRR